MHIYCYLYLYNMYIAIISRISIIYIYPIWEVKKMAISKAQQRAVAKYDAKNYDKICVRIKKGQRDILKAHAEEKGESLNGWIVSAIKAKLKQDKNN